MPDLTCNKASLVGLDPGCKKKNGARNLNAKVLESQPSMAAMKPAVYDDAMQCERNCS